jgi:hypothetical protein
MKKITIIVAALWITGTAFSQSDCKKFTVGKFRNIEKGIVKSEIQRNDSIQVEQDGNQVIKLKIVWINECSYRLIFLEGNNEWWEAKGRNRATPDLIVRITSIEGNSYWQEAKFITEEEFRYRSRIEKID